MRMRWAAEARRAVAITAVALLKCASLDGEDSLPITEGAGCEDA